MTFVYEECRGPALYMVTLQGNSQGLVNASTSNTAIVVIVSNRSLLLEGKQLLVIGIGLLFSPFFLYQRHISRVACSQHTFGDQYALYVCDAPAISCT